MTNSTAVAEFLGGGGALTQPSAFGAAILGTVAPAAPTSSGGSFLKLHADGYWSFGAADDPLDVTKSTYAINPMSLQVGYCAWRDQKKVQEHMAAIGMPPVIVENLPQDLGKHTKGDRAGQDVGYDPQMSVAIQGIEGPDTGVKLMYNTTSHGGRGAVAALMEEVSKRVEEDPVFFVPLVRLSVDSYMNKTYKKTVYTPIIEVVGWGDVHGNQQEAPKTRKRAKPEANIAAAGSAAPVAKRRTRRRQVAAA